MSPMSETSERRGTGTGTSGLRNAIEAFRILNGAGLTSPRFLAATLGGLRRWGASIAVGVEAAATRRGSAPAIIDELGQLSFAELRERTHRIAAGLAAAGAGPGTGVGILCRNHRGFIEASAAAGMLGADALFLNTGFAGPQLAEVLEREGAGVVVYDEEFEDIVAAGGSERARFVAWHEAAHEGPTLEALASKRERGDLPRPARPGRSTLLTSGTTGTPKGASRAGDEQGDANTVLGFLEGIPLHIDDIVMLAAPTFHAWGFAHLSAAAILQSTLILQRRFDPEATLAAIAKHRARTLVVVPVMLQRILALAPEVIGRYDTDSLEVVAVSGSALPGELALRWMDTFGDNLYNLYGSTEVSATSIAGPADLRAAPGTAGRPTRGTTIRLLDRDGKPVAEGESGRIFVGNGGLFGGYTGGGSKEVIDGLMSIGDMGRFDSEGRLFVEGRDDDMIVSGGENVFPAEVEDLLADQPEIAEVAVVGVSDEQFGQRLKAFVVLAPGKTLGEEAIKDLVRNRLARHKIPREVVFLDELPRNPTGKILKRLLA